MLVGVGDGDLAREMYVIDGVYTIGISPTGSRTVTGPVVATDSVCDRIA
ncbi:hypothetical protein ACFW84_32970 [Streptomyces anulatus]